jgi:hypothetical protein
MSHCRHMLTITLAGTLLLLVGCAARPIVIKVPVPVAPTGQVSEPPVQESGSDAGMPVPGADCQQVTFWTQSGGRPELAAMQTAVTQFEADLKAGKDSAVEGADAASLLQAAQAAATNSVPGPGMEANDDSSYSSAATFYLGAAHDAGVTDPQLSQVETMLHEGDTQLANALADVKTCGS